MNDYEGNNSYKLNGEDMLLDSDPYQKSSNPIFGAIAGSSVMTASFGFMFLALLISFGTAWTVSVQFQNNFETIYALLLPCVVFELITVFVASRSLSKGNVLVGSIAFLLYSVLNGATLSIIFFAYQLPSIGLVFLVAAFMFGGCALFGAITKIDLSPMAGFIMVSLIGMIVLGVFAVIFHLEQVSIFLCIFGVLLFAGITAYDVQKIKMLSRMHTGMSVLALGMLGGLTLYLDFINLFLRLLRLFGRRK